MTKINVVFDNELGNEITMSVEVNDDLGVTLTATGPTSVVEHTWTRLEAVMIRYLFAQATLKD